MAPPAPESSATDRKVEFARLLTFFDQLASRGSGSPKASSTPSSAIDESKPSLATLPASAPTTPRRNNRNFIPSDITPVVANLTRVNRLKDLHETSPGPSPRRKLFLGKSNEPAAKGDSSASGTLDAALLRPRRTRLSGSNAANRLSSASTISSLNSDVPDCPSLYLASSDSAESDSVDDTGCVSDDDDAPAGREVAPSPPRFPLPDDPDAQRPFTFRHMLHKLYDKEDWFKTVKESLEQSKNQYKSLSDAVDVHGSDGHAAEQSPARATQTRRRSLSLAPSTTPLTTAHPTTAQPATPTTPSFTNTGRSQNANLPRAVKKRCIGRRKSLNEPLNKGIASAPSSPGANDDQALTTAPSVQAALNAWVYDSMISRLEQENPTPDRSPRKSKGRCKSVTSTSVVSRNVAPPAPADLASVGKKMESAGSTV